MSEDIENSNLRKRVRIIKALQNITYKELAEYLEIKQGSFTNWLSGSYDFSRKRAIALNQILDTLEE